VFSAGPNYVKMHPRERKLWFAVTGQAFVSSREPVGPRFRWLCALWR
jgi:hypothetical protein